jgi:hypothetical protein
MMANDLLVCFRDAFRRDLELIFPPKYAGTCSRFSFWFAEIFHKSGVRNYATQTSRVTLDVRPKEVSTCAVYSLEYYRIESSSLLLGHQAPAAIMLWFPGLTESKIHRPGH